MSALLALFGGQGIKFAAIGLAALALFGAGWKVEGWRADERYAALQASDAAQDAADSELGRKTLQAQLDTLKATQAHNSDVIGTLQNENAQIVADRDANLDLARRLLAGQARPAASSGAVSKADSGQPVAPASGASRDDATAQLLVDVHDECTRNADRLEALIAEIRPQL